MGTGERGRLARLPMTVLAGFAGRSVVASAPALGAGDREFESPRPDCLLTLIRNPDPDVMESRAAVKATKEALSPTRIKITIEVPFEELSEDLASAYKRIGSQIKVPGFRPGK